MRPALIPKNEKQRLASLYNLSLLDTAPEGRFDVITRTAAKIFHVPISTLTLMDSKREWFKSCVGLPGRQGDRAVSFCGHALLADKILVVPDTKKDSRFADNPMVIGKPYLRFYAGVPLLSADGQRIGVFCIKDIVPRKFSGSDRSLLKGLASWAEVEINSRNLSLALKEERREQAELKLKGRELKRLDKSREETKMAMLNVMEDLEKANNQLEMEKVKDEAILASIGDGVVGINKDGVVIVINQAGSKLLGFKAVELLGKKFVDAVKLTNGQGEIIPKDKRPANLALADKITTTATESAYYYMRKDGSRFPAAITIRPIVAGKIIGAIEVFRDITHEQDIDRAKSEFVSLASHQLRTPPTSMNWFLEMLLSEEVGGLTEKQKQYLGEIYRNNKRMIQLVNALLNVSRLEMGTLKIEPADLNVTQSIKEALGQAAVLIAERQLKVTQQYDASVPPLALDKNLFGIIVQNLISNAVKYTPPKGKISVSLKMQPKGARLGGRELACDSAVISVADTGYGIPVRQQAKIFTKLFRADNILDKVTDGTGLGLYMVKSIADQSGGSVWFESEENCGSVFYVSFPKQGMQKN